MTERNLILTAVFVILLVPNAAARADDKTGWGISATLGASKVEDKDPSDTFNGNGFGLAGDIEYRFTPNFALGFGLFSLGQAEDTVDSVDTTITVRGLDVFGRVILPVSQTTDVFARVGSAHYFPDVEPGYADALDTLFGEDAVELGLGVDFGRHEKLAFRVEGRYFNGRSDETGGLLMVGVNYLF